jgi:hypothetical protein
MAGLQKMATNAVRSVAFLLEEMEDTQINDSLRIALDSQMTEFTQDMKILIEDAKERINEHVKASEERIATDSPVYQPLHQRRRSKGLPPTLLC